MSSIACLALIVYFEARGEPALAQRMVAEVAVHRAKTESKPICTSLRSPKSYSFMWDKISNKIREKDAYEDAISIARRVLSIKNVPSRLYFNECSMGKRYKTQHKIRRVGRLCFY
jgi:spore germination cell wall hydrolase CwlJ-like protein